jgi:hypothetical protein
VEFSRHTIYSRNARKHLSEPDGDHARSGIDYERLYRYRHRHVKQGARQAVWSVIAPFVYRLLGSPTRVLDPACGRCEFISSIPAEERWAADAIEHPEARADPNLKMVVGDLRELEFPQAYFDGIFVSNLLEHFATQDEVADFLAKMRRSTERRGRIAVVGPNFRFCADRYFDYADHTLPLTHVAIDEHLYAAGYEVLQVVPRFLPYSFSGALPPSPLLTRAYLRFPPAWRVFGKQYLVLASAE